MLILSTHRPISYATILSSVVITGLLPNLFRGLLDVGAQKDLANALTVTPFALSRVSRQSERARDDSAFQVAHPVVT